VLEHQDVPEFNKLLGEGKVEGRDCAEAETEGGHVVSGARDPNELTVPSVDDILAELPMR
jgi:hypothetical protein